MTANNGRDRLRELRDAFSRLLPTVPGLSLMPPRAALLPADVEMCALLLADDHAQVTLMVQVTRADLTAQAAHTQQDDAVLLRDALAVNLVNDFQWNAAFCGSADELAYLLLKHMRRRLKDAGQPGLRH
jgi:hypothetical protein